MPNSVPSSDSVYSFWSQSSQRRQWETMLSVNRGVGGGGGGGGAQHVSDRARRSLSSLVFTVLHVVHMGPEKLTGQHCDDGLPIRTGRPVSCFLPLSCVYYCALRGVICQQTCLGPCYRSSEPAPEAFDSSATSGAHVDY